MKTCKFTDLVNPVYHLDLYLLLVQVIQVIPVYLDFLVDPLVQWLQLLPELQHFLVNLVDLVILGHLSYLAHLFKKISNLKVKKYSDWFSLTTMFSPPPFLGDFKMLTNYTLLLQICNSCHINQFEMLCHNTKILIS